MQKNRLRVALIGYGFMGKAHSTAFLEAQRIFDLPVEFDMAAVAGRSPQECQSMAAQWGWKKSVTDWRQVVADPQIDMVDIATPNYLHREIALEAARNKKHVLCEKPLGLNVDECRQMVRAVEEAEVLHMIWHTYRKAPAVRLAKKLIEEGCLGAVYHVRARFLQSWQLDPQSPIRWNHLRTMAGSGAHGDLNAHLIDMARYLVGEITRVCGMMRTFVEERPDDTGRPTKVEVDDTCSFLAEFQGGAAGVFESSRMATGRMVNHFIEVNGENGGLYWDFEDMNSLYYYDNRDRPDRRGFRKIQALTEHHPYMEGHWSGSHALGYAHTFINAVHDLACAHGRGENPAPDFYDGLKNQQVLDAVVTSVQQRQWAAVTETR